MSRKSVLPGLILASGSPRRKQLLENLGVRFSPVTPQLNEWNYLVDKYGDDVDGVPASVKAEQLSRAKATEVSHAYPGHLILAADTIVMSPVGKQLGKPSDSREACSMLSSLSGGEHEVYTGVCLLDASQEIHRSLHRCTRVRMKEFGRRVMQDYIDTGEPMGKAGAYAIQGRGGLLVCGIEGSYSNVVGLPVECLDELFCGLGYSIWDYML